jgi:hypothetical protein
MKLIIDMITGIRTIKCYGWEIYMRDKINKARTSQVFFLWHINIILSLGVAIFNNIGLINILAIFLMIWARGELLEAD